MLIGKDTREIVLPSYRKKKKSLILFKLFYFKQEWMTPETQRLSLTNRGLDVAFRKCTLAKVQSHLRVLQGTHTFAVRVRRVITLICSVLRV